MNTSHEHCRHFKIDVEYDPDSEESMLDFYSRHIPSGAEHGDMIIGGEQDLRSMNVFYVNVDPTTKTRKLSQKDSSGSGYTCVPLEITKRLKDPIKFYENAFTFDGYQEIDFLGIEIDAKVHQDLVKNFTNGKSVAENKNLFYFLEENEWEPGKGLFVYDAESDGYVKLTPSTDQKYLN